MCRYFLVYSLDVDLGAIPLHVVEEAQREDMIQEISELVHRQLVTSTLSGNFRTTLELTMRVRLQIVFPVQNMRRSINAVQYNIVISELMFPLLTRVKKKLI
jgi:hypothetical protein